MSSILTLLGKEIRLFLQDKTAVLLTFLVPFVIIFIVGNIFSGAGDSGGLNSQIKLAVYDATPDQSGAALIEALQKDEGLEIITQAGSAEEPIPFDAENIRSGIENHHYNFALVIPPDFTREGEIGIRLEFLTNPKNNIESQIVTGLLQKSIFTGLPKVFASQLDSYQAELMGDEKYTAFLDGMAALVSLTITDADVQLDQSDVTLSALFENLESATSGEGDSGAPAISLSELVDIKEDQVYGQEVENPYLTRMIGGYAIMFLLFATTGSSAALFDERNEGLFLRLLAMPVSRIHILWSKFFFNMLLGVTQTVVLFVGSSLMFKVQILDNLPNLLVVALFSSAACTAFGMVLASVSKTQQQAQGFGTLLIITMSATGGAWFPVEWMPGFMQIISKFTVVYWGVEGFLAALWEKAPLLDLLPYLGMISLITAVLMSIALWRFKTGDLFR